MTDFIQRTAESAAVPPFSPPVVFKQYGQMRTGTNLLRALLLTNHPATRVLMHVLGDKHALPLDLSTIWDRSQSAIEFVKAATFAAPSATTTQLDDRQLPYIGHIARTIADAYAWGSLGYLISIKNPYAWIVSMTRIHRRWIDGDGTLLPHCIDDIADACHSFNERYAAWLALTPRAVVRHEDLVVDPLRILREVESRFSLPPTDVHVVPRGCVQPAHWDYSPVDVELKTFDVGYYTERRYLAKLPERHRQIITDTIDWELLEPLGYAPL